MDRRRIGVAISGGGYRATAWGAGTLLYLADAGLHTDITTVSSVSGGSITNAFFGLRSLSTSSREKVWADTGVLVKRISGSVAGFRLSLVLNLVVWIVIVVAGSKEAPNIVVAALAVGTVVAFISAHITRDATFGHPIMWLYLLAVAACGALLAALFGSGWWWLLGLLLLGIALLFRGIVVGWAIERTLFRKDRRARLGDLNADVEHVICACDLHGRHHVYFGSDFVYSYGLGLGSRPSLPIGAAVQSSANLPGAFATRPMRAKPFRFTGSRYSSPILALTDGGVYDNMAEEWLVGYDARAASLARRLRQRNGGDVIAARLARHAPQDIVVVNASGPLGFQYAWTKFAPLLGELLSLLRVKSILYDNGNTTRRRYLVSLFQGGLRTGIIVHITTNPWRVVADGRAAKNDAIRDRADAVATMLASTEGFADPNMSPPTAGTVLYPLPRGRVAELCRASYVLAMTQGHIWRNWPLRPVPSVEEFARLEEGSS